MLGIWETHLNKCPNAMGRNKMTIDGILNTVKDTKIKFNLI